MGTPVGTPVGTFLAFTSFPLSQLAERQGNYPWAVCVEVLFFFSFFHSFLREVSDSCGIGGWLSFHFQDLLTAAGKTDDNARLSLDEIISFKIQFLSR